MRVGIFKQKSKEGGRLHKHPSMEITVHIPHKGPYRKQTAKQCNWAGVIMQFVSYWLICLKRKSTIVVRMAGRLTFYYYIKTFDQTTDYNHNL